MRYPEVSSTDMFLHSLEQVIWNNERSPYFIFHLCDKSTILILKWRVPKWSCRISYLLNFLYYFWFLMLHFFLFKELFIKRSKHVSKHATRFLCFHSYFRWAQNHRAYVAYINDNYKNVVKKYIRMTSSSKQVRQKTQNTKKQKNSFFKRIGRKCRLISIRNEQNKWLRTNNA